jgi:putative ABC transport system permease protein
VSARRGGVTARVFAASLLLFPRWFRELYADDMRRDFERRAHSLHSAGWGARTTFEIRAIAAVPWQALRVRRGRSGPAGPGSWGHGNRGERGGGVGEWMRDARIAARSLARRPTLVMGVVLTLGLGIGATTTIYSVVDGVILRPLAYRDADRLVLVGSLAPGAPGVGGVDRVLQDLAQISLPNYLDFRDRARSFATLAAIEPNRTVLPDQGNGADLVGYANVAPDLFEMIGGTAAVGRLFVPDDYAASAEDVVVLSWSAWQRHLGGQESAVGQRFPRLVGSRIVVGVLAPDFRPPEALFPDGNAPELWMPLRSDASNSSTWYARRRGRLHAIGRLAPGTSVQDAREESARIAADLASIHPQDNIEADGTRVGIGVNGLHAQTVGAAAGGLGLFMGAAGLLLLLAVMNAATLLLARALDRTRELSVRRALGCGRMRIVRLLMTEAGMLALLGGALGVVLAYAGVAAFVRYAPGSLPRLADVAVDGRVLGMAAAASVAAGVLAGLVPALRLTRDRSWDGAPRTSRTFTEASARSRDLLVGGQIALALVLLTGAGLLFRSFMHVRSVDPGFEPDRLIAMQVETKGGAGWDFQAQWLGWDRLLDALRGVPGVESAALASNAPFEEPSWWPRLLMPGDGPETARDGIAGYAITPGYLETVGTELLRGRDVQTFDGPSAERVALVNESFARIHLGGADPLGTTVWWAAGTEWSPGDEWIPPADWLDGRATPLRIVGLVEDAVQSSAEQGPRPAIYVPYKQGRGSTTAVIRTGAAPEVVIPALRRAVAGFNPRVPPSTADALQDRIAAARTVPRFQALLITAFALVALLIAAAGLSGSIAYSAGRRHREIGVRMALGARRSDVLGMVLGRGMRLAIAGGLVGAMATVPLGEMMSRFLHGIGPHDPRALLMAGCALMVVSAAACLGPARRASAVDPTSALEAD